MRIITIALAALLLAVPPATAADTPAGSVEDLREARAGQDGPGAQWVTMNGNTCFVSNARTYAIGCHVVPEYRFPVRQVIQAVAFTAAAGWVGVGIAQSGVLWPFAGPEPYGVTAIAFGGVGTAAAVIAARQD